MRFLIASSFAFTVAACGGSSGLNTGGGGDLAKAPDLGQSSDLALPPDLSSSGDFAVPPDLAESLPDGLSCGNQTCGGSQKCCVMLKGMMATPTCMDSCPDGDFTVACDGPESCMGNPCCVIIKNAKVSGGGAMCTDQPTACPPAVDIQTQSGMDRLCHVDADCTSGAPNTQLPKCCTVKQNGNPAHICLNMLYAQIAGGTCP